MSEQRVERRLAAILAVDVAGYSRLMGADEEGTLAALLAVRRELGDPKIAEHRGRIVKTTGDGLLVEFASVVDAVRCAVEVQREMIARNTAVPAERRIEFRMGINLGAILDDDVADIDAHAKFDAALCRCRGIAGDHLPLHLDRTAHRVDDAGELGKEAVAGRLDDPTPMLGDFGIAEFTANRTQCRERALFVLAHQPRVAGDIDRQNGRQSSLDPSFAHCVSPVASRNPSQRSA